MRAKDSGKLSEEFHNGNLELVLEVWTGRWHLHLSLISLFFSVLGLQLWSSSSTPHMGFLSIELQDSGNGHSLLLKIYVVLIQ